MASQRSLYDLLNVSHDAEPVVIEAAYRALMKKYHPDQAAAAAKSAPTAADINQAFAVLRDPKRRAGYDHRLWASSEALQLAERRSPPPPRPRSAFGWTGWVVAMLLGAMLFAVVNGRGGLVTPAAVNEVAAAEEPSQASRAERVETPVPVPVPELTAIDREILLREATERAAAAEAARKPEPDPPLLASEPRADASAPARSVPSRSRPARRRATSGRTPAEDEEFLKREGYIY